MNNETEKIYYPTNDYVFRKIFGTPKNEIITKSLLNSILDDEVTSVKVQNNYLITPENINNKAGIIDVKAIINDNIKCDIELQISPDESDIARFLKYWATYYNEGIQKGETYSVLTKTIIIIIMNYNNALIDNIPKIATSWHIREDDFSQIILTEHLEFHIISLRKLQKMTNDNEFSDSNNKNLLNWLKFVINPKMEEELMIGDEYNEAMKKAYEEWQNINLDPESRELARLREKYYDEMKGAKITGYNEGLEER